MTAPLQEFQHATWARRQEIVASLSDPRLRQLGRRLVAFHSPELLSTEEMALFKGYLRNKWFATDVTETEWLTLSKVRSAIEDIREEGAAARGELDAIAAFIE